MTALSRIQRSATNYGWLLALVAVVLSGAALIIVSQATSTPPPFIETDERPKLSLPAAPVDIVASDVACNARRVEKVLNPFTVTYTYKAWHTQADGASVFLQWTDAQGVDDEVVVELNGLKAHLQPDAKTIGCLKDRAKQSEGPGA